jgi:hypothetical protein
MHACTVWCATWNRRHDMRYTSRLDCKSAIVLCTHQTSDWIETSLVCIVQHHRTAWMRLCRVACVFWSTLCCIASYVRIVSAVLPGECAASETSACRVRTGAQHCIAHAHRLHLLLLLPPPLFLFLLLLLPLLLLLLLLLLHVRVLGLASDVVYSTCAASQSDVCRSASDHYSTGATARCTAHAAARAETQRIGKRRESSGYSPLTRCRAYAHKRTVRQL